MVKSYIRKQETKVQRQPLEKIDINLPKNKYV